MPIFSRGRLNEVIDRGLMLALLLTLFHIIPLAMNPGLPAGVDLRYHSIRLAETRGGSAPELITASLAYRLPSAMHHLLGFSAVDALRLLLLASLLACSGGMYLFCRRRSGRIGALLAGLLYAYSPYLMFTQAYALGAYPELLALALFPLLLWRVDALRDKPSPLSFAAVFTLQIALINAHAMFALTLSGIAIAWVAFETAIQRFNREASQLSPRSGLLALWAMLLGILGSAPAWLPMLLASISAPPESLAIPGLLDTGRNAVRLKDLLSPAPIHDASAIKGLRELRLLGVAQWIAAVTGALGAAALYIGSYRTRHPQTFLGATYFGALALALIWLMTPSSADLWAGLRPLLALQYPWQLLGPLAVCLAIVASMNGIWLESLARRYRIGMIALAIALPIVTAIPLLYVPQWRDSQLESLIAASREAEAASGQAGASSAGELGTPAARSNLAHEIAPFATALAILLLGISLWCLRKRDQTERPYWSSAALSRSSLIGILLGGGIALLAFALTFREGIAWLKSPPGEALVAQVRQKYTIEASLQLLGYDLDAELWRAGETLVLSAYWHAPVETDMEVFSFLVLSNGGERVAQSPRQRAGGGAIKHWWSPSAYVIDSQALLIPSDLPSGDYDLRLGLTVCERESAEECQAGAAPEIRDEAGELVGDSIALAPIRLEAR